jgi:hypothetical protein
MGAGISGTPHTAVAGSDEDGTGNVGMDENVHDRASDGANAEDILAVVYTQRRRTFGLPKPGRKDSQGIEVIETLEPELRELGRQGRSQRFSVLLIYQ